MISDWVVASLAMEWPTKCVSPTFEYGLKPDGTVDRCNMDAKHGPFCSFHAPLCLNLDTSGSGCAQQAVPGTAFCLNHEVPESGSMQAIDPWRLHRYWAHIMIQNEME